MRFEPPEAKNRWDSTLFTVQSDQKLPLEEIADSLFNQKAPPPNKSTLNVKINFISVVFKKFF
jgi:tRNA uridine 5-carbamoylmethylation protein Kti12